MTAGDLAAAFGVGAALGAIPGPVQVLILSESARGGVTRGVRAVLGANGTFAVLLLLLAAGVSALEPGPTFLLLVRGAGGAFLVFLGVDGVRSARRPPPVEISGVDEDRTARGDVRSAWLRPVLAVLLNPGMWVFLATTASALVADAAEGDGRGAGFAAAGAMLVGVSVVDFAVMALGTGGRRAFGEDVLRVVAVVLSLVLVGLGVTYLVQAVIG